MIRYNIPWSTDKNLSGAYNNFMELIGCDDWACFVDGDARFTTNFYGKQIEDIVAKHGKTYPLMSCITNRVGTSYQCADGAWDFDEHMNRLVGQTLYDDHYDTVEDITDHSPISGVLILCKKSLWYEFGGLHSSSKMLGVDNDFHYGARYVGAKVGLMLGVYVEHWYRGGDINNKDHLI